MISERIEGATPDAWTAVVSISKLLSLTAGIANTGGANSLDWRLRGKATDTGATLVVLGPGSLAPGVNSVEQWDTPLWEAIIEVKSTVPGSSTTAVLEYVASVEK